jgi:hypothetical protein
MDRGQGEWHLACKVTILVRNQKVKYIENKHEQTKWPRFQAFIHSSGIYLH